MATPHVAGVAALILNKKTTLRANDIEQIIRNHASDVGMGPKFQGSGLIDALSSLNSIS